MNRLNRKCRALAVVASAIVGVLAASSAKAATYTWNEGASWSDPSGWLTNDGTAAYPGDGTGTVTNNIDTAVFSSGSGEIPIDVSPSVNLENIQFDTSAGALTFTGNPLLLTAGGSVQILSTFTGTGVTEAINVPIALEGDYGFQNNSAGINGNILSFGGPITNGSSSASTLTLDGTGTINLTGNISDGSAALSIVKNGTGITTMTGTNSYTGTTSVNNGVLLFGSTGSIAGSGPTINVGANGAVGDINGLDEAGFLSRINNTGTGTLALTAADSSSTLDFTSGPLAAFSGWYLGGGDGSTFTGTIVPTAAGYKFGGNGALTVASNLGDSGGPTVLTVGNGASTGVITFSGTNTYTGGTVLNSGVTVFQSPSAIGGTGQNLQVNAPAAVSSGTGILDTGLLSRISPTSNGALAITSADAATNFDFTSAPLNAVPNMALGTNGNVTYTGTITPANATYRVGGGVGTMDFPNANQFTGANNLIVSGTVEIDGSNNMTGTTTVNNGTLIFGGGKTGASWLGTSTITLNNSTLQMDGFEQHASYPGNANPVNVPAGSNSTINMASYGGWSGALTGAGTLNFVLDYVRAGASGDWSAYTGQINITGIGTAGNNFEIGNGSAVNTISAPNAKVSLDNVLLYLGHNVNPPSSSPYTSTISWGELDGTATAQLGGEAVNGRLLVWQIGSLNTNSLFAGTITNATQKSTTLGDAGLSKVGTGTLTLTGANTYGGPTTVTGGVLQIGNGGTTGTLGTGGAVTVTTPGSLAFDRSDDLTVANNIGGTGQVVQEGNGTLTLTGTNSFAGATVNAGILQGTPSALSGTITLSGGNLNLDGSGTTSMVVAGSGVVNKINGGSIKFSSPQTFTGSTVVQAGSLEFTGANTSDVTVQNGASLVASSANEFSIGSLTLGASAGDNTTLVVNDGSVPTGFSVTNTNGLSANGNVMFDLGTITLTPGDYALINYNGAIGGKGFSAFTTSALSPRVVASLVNTGSAIDLDVTSVDAPKWTGAINGNWDINATQNWKLIQAGTATGYLEGDQVLFDDSATGTTNVSIATTVNPQQVTVNNSSLNYTFGGSGHISGSTALIKQGTGSLTINNSGNDYTGGTQLLGGTIVTGTNDALPTAGDVTIDNGATLDVGGNTQDISGALSLVNGTIQNGTINKSGADYDLQSGTVSAQLNGSAGLTKSGSGTVVLTNASNGYSGATTVNAGTLQYGDGTATIQLPVAITNNGNVDWKIAGSDAVSYGGAVTGGGTTTVDMGPSASLTITSTGQAFAGPTVINGGSLLLNGPATAPASVASMVGSPLTLNNGANLTVTGFDVLGLNSANPVSSLVLNSGTSATAASGSSTELYGLTLAGGTLNGDGTWSIHGNASVTADSVISSGALNISGSRSITINSGVTLNVTSPSLTGGPLTVSGSGTMVLDPAVADALTGLTMHGGEVSVSADTSLPQGTNTMSFTGGTLQVTGTALTTIDTHTVTWAGFQGGFDIADPTNVFTVASAITDSSDATPVIGSVSKLGAGTLVLSGANTYSGGTTISAGTLDVPELANLGTGNITINGGKLLVDDAASLPTIAADLKSSFSSVGGWTTGLFRSTAVSSAGRELGYGLVNGQAEVMYTLPGDLDLSGTVDAADYSAMLSGDGSSWAMGDLNYDGTKNADDWALFMLGYSIGTLPTNSVPEPAIPAMFALCAAGALMRRRRHN